jgi:multiple sugar transport system substrate-binding protein
MTWWLPPLAIGTAVEHAVEAFNENNPGIKVSIEPNPGGLDANLQKWQTMLAAGTPPDVTLMRPHFHSSFAARGAFLQIDELLSAEKDLSADSFWPQTIKRLSYDGKRWGLPAEIWFAFQFLNLDLFAKVGIEPPTADWTWEDYRELAIKLTQGEGAQKQFGANPLSGWWHMMVWAWGGEVLDADEKTCILDKEPAPAAIQWIADLIAKDKASPSAEDLAQQNDIALFETGRVAMFTNANWYLIEAKNKATFDWTVLPNPVGPGGRKSVVQGANYAIFKLTKHANEAWRVMVDMSTGEGQKIILKETAIFPTIQALATLENLPSYKQEWIDVSTESAAVARPHHFVPKFVEMNAAFNKEFGEVWVGRRTAQEAVAAAVPAVNKILQEQ